MKKSLRLLLCFLMLLVFTMPVSAKTDNDLTYGDLTYSLDSDKGEITITGCNISRSGSFAIPAEIEGYPVTSIGNNAFSRCEKLTDITIPDSVTKIGDWAFHYCYGLTNITIPNSVTTIGNGAFCDCRSLTNITIPGSVTGFIDSRTFADCYKLTAITVSSDNPSYCSSDGILFNKDKTNLIRYPIGKTESQYSIPSSVTSISSRAFEDCSSLKSITIPDKVTSIGSWAFKGCAGLTDMTIPNGTTIIDKYTFSGCSSLKNVTIPNSVTKIEWHAFESCCSLTNITIPNCVTSIEDFAFECCSSLAKVVIPNSVTKIGNYAFAKCAVLNDITIPSSVTKIGGSAFADCGKLTSITIPNSVTTLGDCPFRNCDSLKTIKVSSEHPSFCVIDGVLFNKNKTWLIQYPCGKTEKYYSVPNSVTKIAYGSFAGCDYLTGVTIPSSVTKIDDDAFAECTGLTEITIPENVTSMDSCAFADCSSLTKITILNREVEIGYDALGTDKRLTIYGYSGSTAETYANYYSMPFVLIGSAISIVFDDVAASKDWFAPYVNDLVSRGILNGKGTRADGSPYFEPLGLITRGEFSKILAAASGDDLTSYSGYSKLGDTAGHWALPYINWAYEKGIVTGFPDGTFAPDASITREQMAVMICRYAEYKGITLPKVNEKLTFTDGNLITWSADAVYAMQQAGIINGYNENGGCYFKPQNNATRAEAAKMISCFLDL